MARTHRSVRVDQDLLAALEALARDRLVPASFSDQVDAGLRLLARQAREEQTHRAAGLVRADRERAEQTYRRLQDRAQR